MPRIGHRPMYGLLPMLGAKQVAGAGYTSAGGVTFDGSADYYNLALGGSLTGAAAGNSGGVISVWVRPSALTSVQRVFDIGNRIFLSILIGGEIDFNAYAGATLRVDMTTTSEVVTANVWNHILVCFDTTTGAQKREIYLNGAAQTVTTNDATTTTQDIEWDRNTGNFAVAASNAGTSLFGGCIGELFAGMTYMDPTDSNVLAKFISSNKPGSDLSGESGGLVYFNTGYTDPWVDQINANNVAAVSGAFSDCGTAIEVGQ